MAANGGTGGPGPCAARSGARAAGPWLPWFLLTAAWAPVSCTDPRERIVPPDVRLSFAPGTVVTSPDTLMGTVHAFDADGLEFVWWSLHSSDGSVQLDSAEAVAGLTDFNHVLTFHIPAGLASGTSLRVAARARDQAGYTGRDSTIFTIP